MRDIVYWVDVMTEGLSVVIPTHGRHDLLAVLLESISADAEGADLDVEVIIVDDSKEMEAEMISQTATAHNAKVIQGVASVGEKRNMGAIEVTYDLILFLDSDVKIMPGTLRAHMRCLTQETEDVLYNTAHP